jgi:hypothetical protein
MLEGHDGFDIALADRIPAIWPIGKPLRTWFLRGAREYTAEHGQEVLSWGPRVIEFDDQLNGLRFLLDFERAWDMVPTAQRDKPAVLEWLATIMPA